MTGIAEELLETPSEQVETVTEPEVETPVASEAHESQATQEEPEKVEADPEKAAPVEPTATDSSDTVPMSAHIGLRKDLSRQIDELKQKLEAKPTEPEEKVDFFEDPERRLADMESKFNETMTNQLLNEGQAEAIRQHDQETVDKAVTWIAEAVQSSPYLAQQFTNTPLLQQHRKAVDLYQQEQARAELENPEQVKARIRDEVRLELLKEQEAKLQEKEKLTQSIPKTLTGDPSKGGLSGSDWSGPVELESVIGQGG